MNKYTIQESFTFSLFLLFMMASSSFTLALTSNKSKFHVDYHPEIILDANHSYSCALLDFCCYNSIPNITENNNKLYYWNEQGTDLNTFTVPVGSYEMNELCYFMMVELAKRNVSFEARVNKNTMKSTLYCDHKMSFKLRGSIHKLFGFADGRNIEKKVEYESDYPVNITDIQMIRIDCNIVFNSYYNDVSTHTLHQFPIHTPAGYKIDETPKNLIYLPITTDRIRTIEISVKNQQGNLIDFRGEEITCRIHIKRDS